VDGDIWFCLSKREAQPSQGPSQETEALKKVIEDLRRARRDEEARRAKEDQERAERKKAEDEERRLDEAKAKAAADAQAAKDALAEREASADAAKRPFAIGGRQILRLPPNILRMH
jgi:dTMP kinase